MPRRSGAGASGMVSAGFTYRCKFARYVGLIDERKRMTIGLRSSIYAAVLALAVSAENAHAQEAAEFYRGRSVDVYIGTSVGGAYDAYARMLARHMTRHVTGSPVFVPKNMEGGDGMRLANFLYNAAPKDGSSFGTINRGNAFEPLFGGKAAQFEATRFNWIGSTNDEVSVCVAWRTAGVSRYHELFDKELVVGATGPDVQKLVQEIYETPRAIVQKTIQLLQ
jgi:hypothetical protein